MDFTVIMTKHTGLSSKAPDRQKRKQTVTRPGGGMTARSSSPSSLVVNLGSPRTFSRSPTPGCASMTSLIEREHPLLPSFADAALSDRLKSIYAPDWTIKMHDDFSGNGESCIEAIRHLPTLKDRARMAAEGLSISAMELARANMSITCHLSNLFIQVTEDRKRWRLKVDRANSEKAKAMKAWEAVRGEAFGERVARLELELKRKEEAIRAKEEVVARVKMEAENHMFTHMKKSNCKAIDNVVERVPTLTGGGTTWACSREEAVLGDEDEDEEMEQGETAVVEVEAPVGVHKRRGRRC